MGCLVAYVVLVLMLRYGESATHLFALGSVTLGVAFDSWLWSTICDYLFIFSAHLSSDFTCFFWRVIGSYFFGKYASLAEHILVLC